MLRTILVTTMCLTACDGATVKLVDGTPCPRGARVAVASNAQWCEVDGVKDGPFREWIAGEPTHKKREGVFERGTLAGHWKSYFPGGQLQRDIPYSAGKMHGLSTEYHDNGKKKEEGQYAAGARQGAWTLWYPGGARMRATEYSDGGNIETWTVLREADGSKYMEGRFAGGKKDGTFTEYDRAGHKRIQGSWVAGVKEGRWVTFDASGAELGTQLYQGGTVTKTTGAPAEQIPTDPAQR